MDSTRKKQHCLEKQLYEYCPACPLCKSKADYQISGLIGKYARCKQCGAKWFLGDFNMVLVEASKDGGGFSLLEKSHPYGFWQKLKIEELATEEKRLTKEKVEAQRFREEGMTVRDLVFYIFLLNFLIGIGISVYSLVNIPWQVLSPPYAYSQIALFIYLIFLNVSLLGLVYWVARDEKAIEELRNRILELRETKNKRNRQK